MLARLRGTLNVVHFKRAYEDDTHVHIVMEVTAHIGQCLDFLFGVLALPFDKRPKVNAHCWSESCTAE